MNLKEVPYVETISLSVCEHETICQIFMENQLNSQTLLTDVNGCLSVRSTFFVHFV
jgi:hypothetical protein